MNIDTLGQVLIVDNFFSPDAIAAIEENRYEKLTYSDQRGSDLCDRIQAEISCAPVDRELTQFISAATTRHRVRDWADLAWRYVWNQLINDHNVFLSRYTPNTRFAWHADHWNRRAVLNWMLTISHKDSFIEWNTDPISMDESFVESWGNTSSKTLEPNRLIVMPSYYPHRLYIGDDERVSAHGHFNV